MRAIHRFVLLSIISSGLLPGVASRALAQDPTGSCADNPAMNTTTCRIDNPIVTQRMTEYDGAFHPEIFLAFGQCNIFGCNRRFGVNLPGISLRRGDLVTVDADGCAQTGGSGSTWKRYVNPQGANADRLYHGLLGVLNAIEPDGTTMPNPIRIQNVRLQPFWIPVAQPLRLGYEDDNYDDNGYWGHDNGNPEQCNFNGSQGFGGNAFVTVTIQHDAPPPPNAPPMPWDIVAADQAVSEPFDLTALLFNPRWGWQTAPVFAPLNFDSCSSPSACTGQVLTKDEPDFGNSIVTCGGFLGFGGKGHLNWTVVTYKGRIFWDAHSPSTFGDDDYNFFLNTLVTNGFPSGVTANNPQQILLEFQARETIDHFDKTPFWREFHDAVDNNDAEAHIKVDNKEAIAIGLLGLDRVHGSSSESHPIFVLAIHVKSAPLDDTWAIFARNYGNEGWCSDNMHYSNFNNVTLQLPRLISAPATTRATIGAGTQFWASSPKAALGVDVFSAPSQDTFITFHLPSPPADGDDGDRVSGELHLQWSGAAAPITSFTTANAAPTSVAPLTDSGSPEGRLASQFAQLTRQQQATYLAMLPARPPASPDTFQLVPNILSNPPAPASAPPTLTVVRDPRQRQHREDIFTSFCGALSGQLPTDLGTCASYLPFTQLTHTGTPNAAGWINTLVTVTLTAINVGGRGIDHSEYSFDNQTWVRYTTPFTLPEGIITIYYRSQDVAGAFETAKTLTLRIDTTPPSIAGTRTPLANQYGWNNSSVTVSFRCTDSLSGLAPGSPPADTVVSGEGSGQSVTGTCTDLAGNAASATVTNINIDKTPPVVAFTRNPQPNANGWNNTDVTVTFSATDALSGVATVSGPVTITAEGANQIVIGTATDRAGNSANVRISLSIDKTPPEAYEQFDPVSKDLFIFGRDSLSGVPPGPVAPTSVVPVPPNDGDDNAPSSGELRTYVISDLAGNKLVLVTQVKKDERERKSVLVSVKYKNDPVLTLPPNKEAMSWDITDSGTLDQLEQKITVGQGQDRREVQAEFEAEKNQTAIKVKDKIGETKVTRPGLVLIRLATEHGKLVIEF